jgi:hypothetical protein
MAETAGCRAHWLQLELCFYAWRKCTNVAHNEALAVGEAASAVPAEAVFQVPDEAATLADAGTTCEGRGAFPAPPKQAAGNADPLPAGEVCYATTASQSADVMNAADSSCGAVHVSLADYPISQPWRPLTARRADVMAPRALQSVTGVALSKLVRDLRELEGKFLVQDHDRQGCVDSAQLLCCGNPWAAGILVLVPQCLCTKEHCPCTFVHARNKGRT